MEGKVDFYLGSLEGQLQSELGDEQAKVKESPVPGRLMVNIREDMLASLLDRLQPQPENAELKQEKVLLEKQIADLKAQLNLAQAKQGQQPGSNTDYLKTQMARISSKLRESNQHREQQAITIKDLRAQLEQVKITKDAHPKDSWARRVELGAGSNFEKKMSEARKEQQRLTSSIHHLRAGLEQMKGQRLALDKELEAKKLEVQRHLHFIASAKPNVDLELQSQLDIEREQAQKMRAELGNVKAAKAAFESEMESLRSELSNAKQSQIAAESNANTTKSRAQALECDLASERAKNKKLHQRLTERGEALQKQQAETRMTPEEYDRDLRDQLVQQQAENRRIAAALKKAEKLLESERASFQEEAEKCEAFHVADMAKQGDANKKLTLSLKEARQEMDTRQRQWQKEKSVLTAQLQSTKRNHKNNVAALKVNNDQKLKSDCLQWQQERTSMLAKAEKDRAAHVTQLNKEKEEKNTLVEALKKAREQLESERLQWQQERTSLLAKAETDRAAHVSQLNEEKEERSTLVESLKKASEQLESVCLQWQREKMSLLAETENLRAGYVSQLNKETRQNATLVEALTEAEGQLQSQRNIWQEERASLLQARETLNETLQAKEQTESALRSSIEELEEEIAAKKSRKWYRIFTSCSTSRSARRANRNTS